MDGSNFVHEITTTVA